MKRQSTLLLVLLVGLLAAAAADAATWRVEKDGSGDFSVIQDAVDASADGDTLLIGPGRFDDYRRYDLGVWEDRIIHVLLNDRSLTMVGSGEGSTIIGPTVEFPITEHDNGIVLLYGAELYLSHLTLERHYGALDSWDTSYIEVDHCTFQNQTWGAGSAVFSSRGARFSDCTFVQLDTGLFPGPGSSNVVVERCEFRSMIYGINTTSTQNLMIVDTLIEADAVGVELWSSSSAALNNVDIVSDNLSLVVKAASQADLTDCRLNSSNFATAWIDGLSTLTGSGNIIRGNDRAALLIYRSSVSMSDSHFLATTGYAVECEPNFPATPWTIDLRNNWWGVNDTDSVAALILDGHDSPDIEILVDYLPFRDQQVANENLGWGDLKRLYR